MKVNGDVPTSKTYTYRYTQPVRKGKTVTEINHISISNRMTPPDPEYALNNPSEERLVASELLKELAIIDSLVLGHR